MLYQQALAANLIGISKGISNNCIFYIFCRKPFQTNLALVPSAFGIVKQIFEKQPVINSYLGNKH